MSDEPIRIHAQGQHVTVRLVRELFLECQRHFFRTPDRAKAHVLQRIAWRNCYNTIELIDAKELAKPIDQVKEFPLTIAGIPLERDDTMPDDAVWFYNGDRLIASITNLAKPPGL